MAEFEQVVKDIEESEKNVDKVLKAGRLERVEKQPMSMERMQLLLNYMLYTLWTIGGLALAFMFVYFMFNAGR